VAGKSACKIERYGEQSHKCTPSCNHHLDDDDVRTALKYKRETDEEFKKR